MKLQGIWGSNLTCMNGSLSCKRFGVLDAGGMYWMRKLFPKTFVGAGFLTVPVFKWMLKHLFGKKENYWKPLHEVIPLCSPRKFILPTTEQRNKTRIDHRNEWVCNRLLGCCVLLIEVYHHHVEAVTLGECLLLCNGMLRINLVGNGMILCITLFSELEKWTYHMLYSTKWNSVLMIACLSKYYRN